MVAYGNITGSNIDTYYSSVIALRSMRTVVIYLYWHNPRTGHLSKIEHIYGYLKKYTSTSIKFNKKTPEYKNFNTIEGYWGNLYAG